MDRLKGQKPQNKLKDKVASKKAPIDNKSIESKTTWRRGNNSPAGGKKQQPTEKRT